MKGNRYEYVWVRVCVFHCVCVCVCLSVCVCVCVCTYNNHRLRSEKVEERAREESVIICNFSKILPKFGPNCLKVFLTFFYFKEPNLMPKS